MPTITVENSRTYMVRKINEYGGWADVTIRSWPKGGSIDIQSDYGKFSNIWTATGCDDFREFLIDLEYSYFFGKTAHNRGYITDWEATRKRFIESVLEDRRSGSIDADMARHAYDFLKQIDDHDNLFYHRLNEDPIMSVMASDMDYPEVEIRDPQCDAFWNKVWPELCNTWRKEMENG